MGHLCNKSLTLSILSSDSTIVTVWRIPLGMGTCGEHTHARLLKVLGSWLENSLSRVSCRAQTNRTLISNITSPLVPLAYPG